MKLQTLANQINNDCENFNYFWAYGLLKETKEAWRLKDNQQLLNDTAQTILNSIEQRS